MFREKKTILHGWGRCLFFDQSTVLNSALELPLWKLDDVGISDCGVDIVTYAEEVYATCCLNDSQSKVEEFFRSADPSYLYNVFIVRDGCGLKFPREVGNWPKFLATRLEALIVGAYDGEGFILVTYPN